ncbi:hypothetical protein PF005_g30808 [Phytophthora fragariae]|nr:hypothetical protein PF003_g6798 [Phytophthora fragariae]KAE9056911.1 hypothetical protein PF007_g31828 [Phytophthora fragariae]KAE9065627.1 hypothetical protein PF006_g30423 [Phytophthora fragariae]KAE9162542.1 hypothetical protein PF005_g30808 [Phytophthora fragariae]KAE9261215.1 hypothetical protein PF001_g32480 [Phytophthora fragariae]
MQKLYTLVYDKAVAHERHFQQNKRQRMMAKVKDKFRFDQVRPSWNGCSTAEEAGVW